MKPFRFIPRPETQARPDWRSVLKRLAVLAAAIAFPAMAASDSIGTLSDKTAGMAAISANGIVQAEAMPFEQPGMTFPGSAFYYLADPPRNGLIALPDTDPLGTGKSDSAYFGSVIDSGPAARGFTLRGGPGDRLRAIECLSQAIWYEAASESEAGQRAVAQVVLNRVTHPDWPSSVCAVVYQGAQRSTGCQFTFTCDGSLRRAAGGESWKRARVIASRALHGDVYAPVGHATHYHTLWVAPRWASSLDTVGTIGAHRFYQLRGKAGAIAAFHARHSGVEPFALDLSAPTVRTSASLVSVPGPPAPPAIDPRGQRKPPAGATGLAPPSVSANQPPGPGAIGQVKSEYARAGQWKAITQAPAAKNGGETPSH